MSTDANQLEASNRELRRLARRNRILSVLLEVGGAVIVVAGIALASTVAAVVTVGLFLFWAGWSKRPVTQ